LSAYFRITSEVLSIQYVYELVNLFSFACVSKRVQKYNLFLNCQAFCEKYFDLFSCRPAHQ
ncbi:hypothetical protein, partial [Flavobacterium selenitireducens]|uniref:hypothetical protein n=1 Tax=Flavobacterium selenitireducens TaxID=2722704 RepID=UPI001CC2AEDD